MLDELQPDADPVGALDPLGGRGPKDREHQLADGSRRQHAVRRQVVEGRIPRHALVLAVRLDQSAERGQGEAEPGDGRRERAEHRVFRGAERGSIELRFGPVELGQPVPLGLVADVIDEPGEAVDGEQMGPHGAGQRARGHREVLRTGLGHHIGGRQRGRALRMSCRW